jgi:hypothetical protein
VLIDPCNPPREVMLQFNDGANWNRRAYWGEDLVTFGAINSVERRRMGALPEAGKWVRLEVPVASLQMNGMTIRGMSLTVYGGAAWFDRVGKVSRVNVALGKPATMSSWLGPNDVRFASAPDPCPFNCPSWGNDGDLQTSNNNRYFHTGNDAEAWWEVDLGAVQPIDYVDVWNGSFNFCCQDRMRWYWIFVSDVPFTSTSTAATLAQPGVTAYYSVYTGGRPSSYQVRRSGRYVRVQLSGQNYLHASEIQVWAPIAPAPVSLAGGRSATQSSNISDPDGTFFAVLAVNGSNGGGPAHTDRQSTPWWEVDLGRVEWIGNVDVYNSNWSDADGCCSARMSNFYLFVSDKPFASNAYTDILNQPNVSAYYRGASSTGFSYPINRTGRYVRLQLTGVDYLHSLEVSVWSSLLKLGALAAPPAANTDTH